MINRVLLRIKAIQIIYSFYQSGSNNYSVAEKELMFSLGKSYELYNSLLYLIVEMTKLAERRIDMGRNKMLPTEEEKSPNTRLIDNKVAKLLTMNAILAANVEERKIAWEEEFVREMLDKITLTEFYKEYMSSEKPSFDEDKKFWVTALKQVVFADESLEHLLEEESLYWNDDLQIVSTFVSKTIKRLTETGDNSNAILPMFKDDEDRIYVCKLLRISLQNADSYRNMITDSVRNWDMDRVAFMDIIIMQTALAELLEFNEIPANVTFNEYLEIAKVYSTERSATFINGILDNIYTRLKKEGVITK